MKGIRSWQALGLTILLFSCVLLSGCTSSSASDNPPGVTTVHAWVMGDGTWKEYNRKLADQFNREHHTVQVQVEFIPWEQGHDKLITAAVADAGPDVTTVGGRWTVELAAMNALEPLDAYIDDTYKQDFVDTAWQTTQWKGKTWGIPQGFTTVGLFYRTDWLREAGYDHAPQTWSEFRDVAKKMTQGQRYGFALVGDRSMETTMSWTPFLWQNGGELLSKDLKKAAFQSPAGVEALEFYVDLYRKDHSAPPSALNTKRNDAHQMFTHELAAMTISGPWFFQEIQRQSPNLPYAVAPYPIGKQAATLATTDHIVMMKTAKNKPAAWQWIDYVTNREHAQEWNQLVGFIPYRKSSLEDKAFTRDPNYRLLMNEVQQARTYPTLPEWPQIDNAIANAVQEALAGKKQPKEALEHAAKQVDEILAQAY